MDDLRAFGEPGAYALLLKPGTNGIRPVTTTVVVTGARLNERNLFSRRTIDRREMHLCQSDHR